jgi:DDE superfamily endonuclease
MCRRQSPCWPPAPKLDAALEAARQAGNAFVVLDGTLIPIDRLAADRPFYSGKHREHGMNLQVIASPEGEILWASGALPGSVHDLTAARIWGIVRRLAAAGLIVLADKGYIGAGEHVLTPYRGRNKPASQRLPTAPTPGCAPRASVPTPSSRPGTSCASYAAAPGAPGGSLVMAIVEPAAVPAGFCPERATSGVAASGCSGVSC